jgi:hypothetical protein
MYQLRNTPFAIVLLIPLLAVADQSQNDLATNVLKNPFILPIACAKGAVETAYSFSPEKLSGNLKEDIVIIANASKRTCITPMLMKAQLQKKDYYSDEDKSLAATKALTVYVKIVADVIKDYKPRADEGEKNQ